MLTEKLLAVLLWANSVIFRFNLYLYTPKLIWLKSARISSMRIRNLQTKMSLLKLLLKYERKCNRSWKGIRVILAIRTFMYITVNYWIRLTTI